MMGVEPFRWVATLLVKVGLGGSYPHHRPMWKLTLANLWLHTIRFQSQFGCCRAKWNLENLFHLSEASSIIGASYLFYFFLCIRYGVIRPSSACVEIRSDFSYFRIMYPKSLTVYWRWVFSPAVRFNLKQPYSMKKTWGVLYGKSRRTSLLL